MSSVQQDQTSPRMNRLGGGLVALALVAVIVAYPPPATGVGPLFGVATMFLPLIVSVVALLLAVAGGVILARNITNAQTERSHRLAFGVLVPVGAVAVISVYLVVIAGFGPQAPFIIGAVLIAVVGGIVDEFLG